MARRLRIRRAIARARDKHRSGPASPPLGDRKDARPGTPASVPSGCAGLSGALPQPPLEARPLFPPAHFTADQLAAYEYLGRATDRRWKWAFPPYSGALFLMAPWLGDIALQLAAWGIQGELKLYRVRMALSMWISRLDTAVRNYTLSQVGDDEKPGPHP